MNKLKAIFKHVYLWQLLLLIGVFIIFITIGWYAKVYGGDDETIKYAVWIIGIVGVAFIIGSIVSYTKKEKIRKKQEELYGKGKD